MAISDIMKAVNRSYGKGTASFGVTVKDIRRLPTGIISLDNILQGGLPFGRAIEIYGAESAGKSTLASIFVAAMQREIPDLYCVWVDSEGTYDPVYGEILGVDNSKLIYLSPENLSAEQTYDTITELLNSGEVSMCVLDDIPSLESGQEEAKDVQDSTMAPIAGPLSKFCKKLKKALLRHRDTTIYVGLNQLRDNFNPYGAPTLTPGGRAWKHACSVRFEVTAVPLDASGKEMGRKVDNPAMTQISVCKIKDKTCNKMGRKKIASFVISDNGLDTLFDLYNAAVSAGIIKTAGSKLMLLNKETGEVIHSCVGKDAFRKSLTAEHIAYLKSVFEEETEKVDESTLPPLENDEEEGGEDTNK